MGAPSLALLMSMNPPSALPVAVVPPPMRMRVPLASRRRRREVRPLEGAVSLISNSCALPDAHRRWFPTLAAMARRIACRLQLIQRKDGECGSDLSGDGRLVVQ